MKCCKLALRLGFMTAVVPLMISAALGQGAYPTHPVKIIVPFTAGGGVDLTARELARRLETTLGQPVIVDNKPGAGGALGVKALMASPPDGQTLLLGTAGEIAMLPLLNPAIGYDPLKDLTPIALVVRAPNVLVVNSDVPARTLPELIAYAKANPGVLTYSTSGVGTAQHLQGEYFGKLADVDIRHIPYKGSAQQVVDVAGKVVSMTFASPAAVRPYIQKGQVRALGVTTSERVPVMPDVPAIREAVKGYELQSWFALFAPVGTSPAIVNRLNKEVTTILREPNLAAKLNDTVGKPSFESPAEFASYLAGDVKRFGSIISNAKITLTPQ